MTPDQEIETKQRPQQQNKSYVGSCYITDVTIEINRGNNELFNKQSAENWLAIWKKQN